MSWVNYTTDWKLINYDYGDDDVKRPLVSSSMRSLLSFVNKASCFVWLIAERANNFEVLREVL